MTLKTQKTPPSPPTFSWLFKAYFNDGSMIQQTAEDALPDSNQYKEVLDRLDDLIVFKLVHIDGKQSALVDLMTGNFAVNSTPICIHNQMFDPTKYKLDLVYHRERREQQTQDTATGQVEEKSFINRYFIGWKTQVNGKDKQVTLAVG